MQYFQMLLFIGMTTFPGPMLDGYKLNFAGPAKSKACFNSAQTVLYSVFNVFGCNIGVSTVLAGAMSREGVSQSNSRAQSVACLVIAMQYLGFMISDGSYAASPEWPAGTPKDGVYANFVVWSVLILLLLSAWRSSGAVKPNFDRLMPVRCAIEMLLSMLFFPWLPLTSHALDLRASADRPLRHAGARLHRLEPLLRRWLHVLP